MRELGNKRKWFKRSIIASLLIFSGFVGGVAFCWSFYGSLMMFGIDVPNGMLAVAKLHQLEKGNSKPITMDLEHDIDSALAQYSFASEEWWFPVYDSGWLILFDPNDFEKYLRKAATYRKSHPSPYRDAYKGMKDQELAEFSRDYDRRIDEMVEKYAE